MEGMMGTLEEKAERTSGGVWLYIFGFIALTGTALVFFHMTVTELVVGISIAAFALYTWLFLVIADPGRVQESYKVTIN